MLKKFLANESGATAVEYGLIFSAIGLALTVVLPPAATTLKDEFIQMSGSLN